MGDQHSYTVRPTVELDLRALYREYCEFLVKAYGTLDFRGIVQMQNVVRLRLEEVYVPLRGERPVVASRVSFAELDDDEAPLKGGLDALGEALSARTRPRVVAGTSDTALHELVRDHAFLAILGEPGAGKSTLVRALMLALAEGRAATFGLGDEWLPVFFPVAAFAEARGRGNLAPLDFLRDYYRGRNQSDFTPLFERALLAGRALVLLDGLDEVREDRLAVVRSLEDFIRRWDAPGNRFVATSRIAGYEDAPLDDMLFVRTTVREFADDDIGLFAQKWSLAFERAGAPELPAADPLLQSRAAQRAAEFTQAVFANSGVTALARNPLLLTILALIHNQGTRLPDRRVELYRLCVEALAETWNRARGLAGREIEVYLGEQKIDEGFVVNLLGPAALWIHEESPGGLVEERDLARKLAEVLAETDGLPLGKARRLAEEFIGLVNRETGLIQERGHRLYGFLHLTFEEYLAARALLESSTVKDLDNEIHRRAGDPGWREVLRLAMASASQREAPRLLLHLLKTPTDAQTQGRPVVLAGECLQDLGRNRATQLAWRAVVAALVALVGDPEVPLPTRVEGGHLLGRLGDPRLLDPLTGEAAGHGDYDEVQSYWCPIEAGTFWFGDDRADDDEDAEDETEGESGETEAEAETDEERPRPSRFDPAKLQRIELPHGFKIARYPVTNAEFAAFLAANGPDGYNPEKPWWTEEGRKYIFRNGKARFTGPRQWNDAQLNSPAQPVVGISWYEAAAYCRWLSAVGHERGWLPKDEVIRLPTSLEWERAARHSDQRPFPWGDAIPTAEHTNFADTKLGSSSPVGCFPSGRARCGADDLVGNVLEWLATSFSDEERTETLAPQKDFTPNQTVLLSFTCYIDRIDQMYCGTRYRNFPLDRYVSLGFRVVHSLVLIDKDSEC
jgi:formylglycine-generating enzyme required for sulfatase activity/energy-coupling factor transporter ATP-binding protein EcfA2